MKTNLLSRLLVAGFLALAPAIAFADEEQDLLNVLNSNTGAPQKCDACQKLRLVGTVKSVPALAALLTDAPTAHPARYALEGMPFPEAVAALREAFAKASGEIKAGLIDSLGWRRDAAAVPLLSKSLSDSDRIVASAAASALGRIGGKKAIDALTAASKTAPPAVQPAVLDGLSRCADQLLAGGDTKAAAALYRMVFVAESPESIRVAAWRGLALADTKGRVQLVVQALTSQERAMHLAALKVLRELNDPAVVEECLHQWAVLPADGQLAVLDARVEQGGDLLVWLRTASQSPHLAVRVAAWQALANSGDPAAIPALARAASTGEPEERAAVRDSLTRLRGPRMHDAFLQAIASSEPKDKVELLRALGERFDTNATAALLDNAGAGPDAVRSAALESLRKIADPASTGPLIALVAKSPSDADRDHILSALYAVCESSRDKDRTTATVLGAMKSLPPDQSRLVLPVLSELATPAALDAVLSASREKDPESVKQAVSVLTQWPNAAPATSLLQLASITTDPVLQVLAMRGCINVSALEPDLAKRLALLQNVLAAAKRTDEKKQALSQIGQVPTLDALQVAMGYLADDQLSHEAGLAALDIAEKLAPFAPDLARETADKVLAQSKTPDLVTRAWAIRGKKAGSGPFIEDWLVSGPYSKPGVIGAQALFDIAFPPETPDASVPWKALPRAKIADLASFFPGQFNCVAYLKTRIIAPRNCDAALLLGSDDGVKAWLNGAVVHSNNVDRGLVVDQDMAPIQLKEGGNELLLKITQGGGGWGACARILGSDGRPLQGLKAQVEP
ncbi:MAG TPA: HEAT repeat domain-containing protein [Candidatus Acidoferrum sp.]|jgi:HEAT repeat protein|nr:HEAT repeat domain-containing protein [Candidatus Acidoferrum sp.]